MNELDKADFKMEFDIGTIKHLGVQMYSTLPPVIAEMVSNAWDADAEHVLITLPEGPVGDASIICVEDNGTGMSDQDVREAYLVVGRDKREEGGDAPTLIHNRKVMGRKGIGKFSAFGVAGVIEVETTKNGDTSRFVMSLDELAKSAQKREILIPPMPPTGTLGKGTRITLSNISKFRSRSINIQNIRRGLARRFATGDPADKFEIVVNGSPITPDERDLKLLLDRDADGKRYLWEYHDEEIATGTGWKVSGWIGTLDRTNKLEDGIQRGITVMARKKLVQEPFVFDTTVGQQYALSYLIGELHAEFVDESEDTISTTRNSLVWDSDANIAFKEWGQREVNRIARDWGEKRKKDNEAELAKNAVYQKFTEEAKKIDNKRALKVADKLIKDVIQRNPLATQADQEPMIQMCLDFLEFDAFWDLAQDLTNTDSTDPDKLLNLFREWEVVEAKEMMRVTSGRITTIEKLQKLIAANALEVPTLHNFLKEFPWVLDPRWTLVADEKKYSQLLKTQFPQASDVPDEDKRIDFLCVQESDNLIVVEIKRPKSRASSKELNQILEYVEFMRDHVLNTTDPAMRHKEVVGYLLCGDLVDGRLIRQRRDTLAQSRVYVRRYDDLLRLVESNHKEFLSRYKDLKDAKTR